MHKKSTAILAFTLLFGASRCVAQQAAATQQAGSAQPAPNDAAYKNPALSVEQRAKESVSRMTLEEKVSQIGHTADAVPRLGIPEYNWWNEGLHGVARAGTLRYSHRRLVWRQLSTNR